MNSDETPPLRPAPAATPSLRPAFLLALGLVSGLWGGITLDRQATAGCASSSAAPNYRLIGQAWNQIQLHYVDRAALNATNLTYGAIGGMVDALGDTGHSTFLSPAMVRQLKEARRGRLQGHRGGNPDEGRARRRRRAARRLAGATSRAAARRHHSQSRWAGHHRLAGGPGRGPHHRPARHTRQPDHPRPALGPHCAKRPSNAPPSSSTA